MPHNRLFLTPVIMAGCICSSAANAQSQTSGPATIINIRIEPQGLETALLGVARASGREIVFAADIVANRRAPRVIGRFTALEAVRRLLRGSPLTVRDQGGTLLVIAAREVADAGAEEPGTDIVVTGSRIRGAQAYAPVTTISRDTFRAAGQTDLGEAMRTLPQNFGGGQSPYIGLGAEDFGSENLNSGSSINLRGLGPGATLTLLNGRRLAYDGVFEGVDVAAIPLAAIDRVEVIADGASAIYGSDAVAGVANIVLRRDFRGLETTARVGAATDGGDVQEQVQAVAGDTWSGGGVVATLSYDHNSAITANQRAFSRQQDRTTTILPSIEQFGAVLSGHQSIGTAVEVQVDLLYSRRSSYITYPNADTGSYLDSGVDRRPVSESFAAAPLMRVALGGGWSASGTATYARDALATRGRYFLAGAVVADQQVAYKNESASGEIAVEGALASLGGGEARLAAGGGYRWVGLASRRSGTAGLALSGSRDSYYAFGEIDLPIFGAVNERDWIKRLSANVAGRFEHYPRIGSVFTPKLGLLYAPVGPIELRATWGRSFKAPTLFQLNEAQGALLFTADTFGGLGYPATATAVYAYGGNVDLKPQRATSWSAGLTIIPFADRRLTIDATYFNTRYTDRIVAPISSAGSALSDPLIAELIEFDPTPAAIDSVSSAAPLGLVNYSGLPYDPANVVAIIDNRNRNVAQQRIHGVDVAATWRLPLPRDANLLLTASGTYLHTTRQLSSGQPLTPLGGTILNPPRFRARVSGTYNAGGLTANTTVSLTGGVDDTRFAPSVAVGGQTTVDFSLGYTFPATTDMTNGLRIQLSMLNAFNDLPDRIRTAQIIYTAFDATNYNPVGRLVSLTVAKRW